MLYEQEFLFSLLLTLVVEVPLVFLVIKYLYKLKNIKIIKVVLVGIISSSLTLPYFWFVLPAYIFERHFFILFGEMAVVLVEALIYLLLFRMTFFRSFCLSFIANLGSVFVGSVLF